MAKDVLMKANRLTNVLFFFLTSVDLSPLAQEESRMRAQPDSLNHPNRAHKMTSSPSSDACLSHPYAASAVNNDISSAARAYLPNSTSLLTTTTSYARLYQGKQRNISNSQSMKKTSGEMNSWPSSILMHPLNAPSQKAAASSPIRQKAIQSEQMSWRESLEQQLGLDRKQVTCEHSDHYYDKQDPKDGLGAQTMAMQRKYSVPVLRGVSHANRQRQSMLLSLAQDEPDVDEFGQLIKVFSNKQNLYSTTVIGKNDVSVPKDVKTEIMPFDINTTPIRSNENRDTFGVPFGRNINVLSEKGVSMPRTPPQARKSDVMACPPTLGLDTPALIGTQSTFDETSQKRIQRTNSIDSLSSSTRSIRSRLRLNEAKNIVLHPSPHSKTFRFPALCIAAMDRTEAMKEALTSPNHIEKQKRNHSPSISLASARYERPSATELEEIKHAKHDMLDLLGSPIKLTSEDSNNRQVRLKSKFSSSSESSLGPRQSFEEKRDDDDVTGNAKVCQNFSMKQAQSESHISTMGKPTKPRSLFESESMPIVSVNKKDELPITPRKREKQLCKAYQGDGHTEVEPDGVEKNDTLQKSSLVISSIIEQQEEVMQKLRRSSKWSPANLRELSPSFNSEYRSSWTWAASTDVELDVQSDLEIPDPSTMDKFVDWECNAVSYDVNGTLHSNLDVERNSMASLGGESQTKAGSEKTQDTNSYKKADFVEKSVQTDASPPPRPARNGARKSEFSHRKQKLAMTKPPDICILLASPRGGDDENPNHGLSYNVGLGIVSSTEDPSEDTMDESLLTPRAIEEPLHLPEDQSTTLEVFEQEMDALIQTLSTTLTPFTQNFKVVNLPSESEESSKEVFTSPPQSKQPLVSSATVTLLQAPRESTTTATIEAMIEQLRIAQRSPERLVLNKGGRRHENKTQQD